MLRVNNGDLHEFVIQWNHVLSNMGEVQIQTSLLRDAFYRKIEKFSELAYDLNIYERMAEADPDKTYEFLMDCVESAIRMQDKRRTMTEREQALKANAQGPAAKPAAVVTDGAGIKSGQPAAEKDKPGLTPKEPQKKGGGEKEGTGAKMSGVPSSGQPDGGQKGKAKGGGKDNVKGTTKPCYFYHFTKCTNETGCPFSHAPITEEQKKELGKRKGKGREASVPKDNQPAEGGEKGRSRERSTSPRGKGKPRQNIV